MFKISTKGDYGLLLLSALAEKAGDGRTFISLKEIARAKKLSLSYISQIIIPLKNAGFVLSKEGKEGGYRLAKSPNKITIMEILEALEGPVSPVKCCCPGASAKCGSEAECNVKATWMGAKMMLMNFLRKKTLADTLR
ncbi:MAG: Rrf2 family transcriptional regulator [Patescibacteria group bacterium]